MTAAASTAPPFGAALLRGIRLGALLGCAHGLGEGAVYGWFGLEWGPLDFTIALAAYVVAAGMAGAAAGVGLAGVVALAGSLRGRGRPTGGITRRFDGMLLTLLLAGYAHVARDVLWRPGLGWQGTLGFTVVVIGAAVIAATHLWRPRPSAGTWWALFGIAIAAAGGSLLLGFGRSVSSASALTWTTVGVGAGVTLLAILVHGSTPADRRRPRAEFFALLTAAALLVGYLTVLPRAMSAHVRHPEPRPTAQPPDDSPSVLFVVLDTLRADHMDLFGYERETMPRLKRFAEEECALAISTLATAPSSLPSHASMFTGLYPARHGGHKPFLDDPSPPPYAYFIHQDAPSLAGHLGELGYRTAGICANFGVLDSYGLDRGFQDWDVVPGAAYLAPRLTWIGNWRFLGRKPGGLVDRALPESIARRTVLFTDREPPYRRAEVIRERSLDWIDEHGDEPFFLFLNFFDPHDPYLPPPAFDERFVAEPEGLPWVGFPVRPYGKILRGEYEFRDDEVEYLRGQYDAELAYLDVEVDRLFQSLRDRGVWDETMIVVVSDHGEGFLDHGFLRHSTTLYQDMLGIPTLVKLPKSRQAELPASAQQLQFVDLLPTICSVIGVPSPDGLDGRPWGEGREYGYAEVYCQHPEIPAFRREMAAEWDGQHKYVRIEERPDGETRLREELYDLIDDPQERENLAPGRDLTAARMRVEEHLSARRLETDGREMTEAEILKLIELGYLTEADLERHRAEKRRAADAEPSADRHEAGDA